MAKTQFRAVSLSRPCTCATCKPKPPVSKIPAPSTASSKPVPTVPSPTSKELADAIKRQPKRI